MTSRATVLSVIAMAVLGGLLYGTFRPRSSDTSDDVASNQPTPHSRAQEEIFPRVIAFSRHNTNAEDIVRQFFSEEDVPVLLSMLLEPVYRSTWQDLIWVIPHLSTSETRDAIVSTFVEFSARDGSWKRWESDVFNAKLYSIRLLGYLGGEQADSVLRSIITKDGAREFSEAWRQRQLPGMWGRGQDVIGQMQSEAAMGLVFTQRPENIQLVEELHRQLYDEAQSVLAITGREYTRQENNIAVLFELVSEALAMRDMMQELGYDEFKPLFFDTLARWARIGPYLTKYGVPESP